VKFRKKPVVIDAEQWTGKNYDDMERFITIQFGYQASPDFGSSVVAIPTLEGTMTAAVGDWIIKGVNGEFYPCKPDIFEKTYEPAEERLTEAFLD